MIGYLTRATPYSLLSHSPAGFENEPVANTMHGLEVNGLGRIQFELLTQSQNAVIDCAGAGIVFKAPDLVQEFVPRDHTPGTCDKESENFEFQSSEDNRHVQAADFPPK
jgi:hypothetical protein